MIEKKAGRVIIFVAFAIIICASRIIWFFTEKYFDFTNYENREMAARPILTIDNYGDYSKEYTNFFNDNLQFRNALVTLNNGIDYFCFKKSSNNNVVIGDNNWLFYSRVDDGDPISCYQGTNLYSDEELELIAQNCITQRDFLAKLGKEFVIFIAPNKERIYSEYMPERYGNPADNYGALQIYNYLKENTDLRVVYPYDEMMIAKNKVNENIYAKTDTHWNSLGGYVGASALLKELGIVMPELYGDRISIIKGDKISGDLAGMLNLSKQLRYADNEYTVEGYDLHNREKIEWDFSEMVRYHATDADPRSIFIIRDSFAAQMALYIGSQFTDSYLYHQGLYNYEALTACNPNIVVFEAVERRAGRLTNFSIR